MTAQSIGLIGSLIACIGGAMIVFGHNVDLGRPFLGVGLLIIVAALVLTFAT